MRHRVDHRKLGRTQAHRKAMLANMVTSLFDKERIRTTDAKAKEARRQADRLITRAKKGYAAYQEHLSLKDAGKTDEARQMQAAALAHWRQAGRVVRKQSVLKKLFDVIAPRFLERDGGYTRILHLQRRAGDNAKTVLLELVGVTEKRSAESSGAAKKTKKKPTEAKAEDAAAPKRQKKTAKKEAAGEPAAEADKVDAAAATKKTRSKRKTKTKKKKKEEADE